MRAKDALKEIEQWRYTTVSPQHQLDGRWIERFRELASYDSYWWLAWSGPFTEKRPRKPRSF
jgi:hypothetical protein